MNELKELDLIVMNIVVHAGNARSLAIEALRCAREGAFVQADEKMKECEGELQAAHSVQTELLVDESNGSSLPVSLIMVHAQDHLMNAMTVKDLSAEIIAIMKRSDYSEKNSVDVC